eukprot:5353030-Prorocentrum_lima.AAC.1
MKQPHLKKGPCQMSPGALSKEVHKLDSPGAKNWAKFYHGLTTNETLERPLEMEVDATGVRVNAVRNLDRHWINPSSGARVEEVDSLQRGFLGGASPPIPSP